MVPFLEGGMTGYCMDPTPAAVSDARSETNFREMLSGGPQSTEEGRGVWGRAKAELTAFGQADWCHLDSILYITAHNPPVSKFYRLDFQKCFQS